MRTVSNRNLEHQFGFEPRESRLRKMAGLIRSLTPGKLLDIGCQRGEWTRQWLEAGWTCCGVDINSQDVQAAKARGIQAKVCDLNSQALPFHPDGFDLVIAGEMIEHLVDTSGFLQEARRVSNREDIFF